MDAPREDLPTTPEPPPAAPAALDLATASPPAEDPNGPADATARVAGRVVLLDPSDAFLLIRAHDPFLADSPTWWHVPGGGLDPGESPQQGAIREISEEVGIRLTDVGPVAATRVSRFQFAGRHYVQQESFFVVRLPERVDVDAAAWTDLERKSTLDWRWWTVDEVRATAETVYPRRLASLVSGWLAHGTDEGPVDLS
ncbi:NUDIX hydrolase [Pseudofrankia inefficax]|uniref:NUDIX hydrolase n=1 Tax=Pseudofrankia inefficax (strain DSM 45817 / CECT 9037 / DDB 130130 / EuI1c) TaxID=298654 RepID=E3JDN2_PSEI1|nr:NUDIX domain-containing protein [Pseudofrankia inefficax]ADP84798.1 NUDIX hydrolase [Pseudofrankia inefficax]